jgi:hypothetical protein
LAIGEKVGAADRVPLMETANLGEIGRKRSLIAPQVGYIKVKRVDLGVVKMISTRGAADVGVAASSVHSVSDGL